MNTEFRNRAFLPLVLPIGILLVVVGLVVGFAMILLYNTREASLILAITMAGAILLAMSLASSEDELTTPKKAAISLAVATPLVLGILFAAGVGNVDDSLLNINRQPHEDPAVAAGRSVAMNKGCAGCHSVDGSILVGPSWLNLWGSEVTLNSGETVTVDEEYIRQSVRNPNDFAREGFNTGVMPVLDVSDEEINQIIAYMKSLSENSADGGTDGGAEGESASGE